MTEPPPALTASPRNTRLVLVLAGFVVLGVAFIASLTGAGDWADRLLIVLDRLRHLGPLGWIAFIGLQALVALIGFLPASLLGLAAGAVYGVGIGFGLSATGLLLGALLAFAAARSTLRPAIIRLLERHATLERLDTALARDGWRLVLLMRVSPVMPFSLTSFVLGLSGIALRAYIIGTLASLPALLLYVILGALGARSIVLLHNGPSGADLVLLGIGIVATALLALRIGQLIARALRTQPQIQAPNP